MAAARTVCASACVTLVGAVVVHRAANSPFDYDPKNPAAHLAWIKPGTECECIPWKLAFIDHGANCSGYPEAVCERFLMQLEDDKCVQQAAKDIAWEGIPGHTYRPQEQPGRDVVNWCYVSALCTQPYVYEPFLHARPPYVGALWKDCDAENSIQPGKSQLMSSVPFGEFVNFITARDLDIGVAMRMAYPTAPIPMEYVLPYWGFGNVTNETGAPRITTDPRLVSDELRQLLDERTRNGTALIFGVDNPLEPPWLVMEGEKVWWVNFGQRIVDFTVVEQGGLWDHPGLQNEVTCIKGCESMTLGEMPKFTQKGTPYWHPFNDGVYLGYVDMKMSSRPENLANFAYMVAQKA